MKITRHTAPDMRQALRAIRAQLGPDAVILSTQSTANGVEVTAAMDFDAAAKPEAPVVAAPTMQVSGMDSTDVQSLGQEIKSLRRMLETQVAHVAWNDLSRRAPVHMQLLRELTEAGLSQELASRLVARTTLGDDLEHARQVSMDLLEQEFVVNGDRWLDQGGRIALVGPTGVGKTTTLAKLAVRWVLRHGPRDLALVAGDAFRIGAQAQLQTLGRLLGVAVHTVEDLEQLPQVLERLSRHRLILIDTPGSSQRDPQTHQRLSALSAVGDDVECALVLAANTQVGTVAETLQRFAVPKPACCVITKLDEASSIGGLLSLLAQARLPLSYVSDGQRVPEDLRPARAPDLVATAFDLARSSVATADEELLKRRFGDTAHGFA